ncbi:MAG TPA: uroporphyrinogen decarboxylase [Candidatus Acidoferrales bacterium]|nr:uroporphyrinogen decarboxylase [Candidatus Acidoferrales bacterium]
MKKLDNDLILRVLRGEPVERTPIWIMRQAGRYLPEYMRVRAHHDFLTLCKTPELSAEVTIQPVDIIGVDAAIIFSDILLLPEAMGMNLIVEEGKGGPRFTNPIKSRNEISTIHDVDCVSQMKFLADAIQITVARLNGRVPLIGFCGSPWTMLAYMVEGRGGEFVHARAMLYDDPSTAHQLLEILTRNCISYLRMQVEAGANLAQIFDTWAGILTPPLYEEFSLRYIREIVDVLRKEIPIIVFSKGANLSLEKIGAMEASAVGVDWTIPINEAGRKIRGVIQGNLDPAVLFSSPEVIATEAEKILRSVPKAKHIFNLGHGILPSTPMDNVKSLVDFVKSWRVD